MKGGIVVLFYYFLVSLGQDVIQLLNKLQLVTKTEQLTFNELDGLFIELVSVYNQWDSFFQFKRIEMGLGILTIPFKEKIIGASFQKGQVLIFILIIACLSILYVLECYNKQIKQNTIYSLVRENQKLSRQIQLLSTSVKKKEILLKEIHHRVKNNLQLVMSLLDIQAQDKQQISINEFLEKGQMRIATMALIHQTLYLSENFDRIDFQDYLENLVTNIKNTYCANQVGIAVQTNGNTFDLDTAIPLGLIVNELVCNSLKHAFPTDLKGQIHIAIHKNKDNTFELHIRDDGVGMVTEVRKPKSIGLEMVSLLVKQLQGKMEMINQPGLHYRIVFAKSHEN